MWSPYRLVIADDQAVFRQIVKELVSESNGVEVVGEAADGFELLNLLKTAPSEMVVVDLSMPKLNGLEAIRQIKRDHANLKVLVLTVHKSKAYLVEAMAAGADGFVLKEYVNDELLPAVAIIRGEGLYVSKIISVEEGSVNTDCGDAKKSRLQLLTPREIEVLCLVSSGKSSREIAELLHLSVVTVKNHRSHVKKKLKIKSNAELISFALRNDLLLPESPGVLISGSRRADSK